MTAPLSLASDNWAPAHPATVAAIAAANDGPDRAYGYDAWTQRLEARTTELFGEGTAIFPVFNGTAANVLCLETLLARHEAVVCADTAHIATDECGAPERHLGAKLLIVPTSDGKLTPELIAARLRGPVDEHRSLARVVSITQTTERGTLYTAGEVAAIADFAHEQGLLLHMDGARIGNAAAALGLTLREATRDLGVDALSLGMTKNGAVGAEAVVLFRPELAAAMLYRRKQAMQLASKLRYASAQLLALLGPAGTPGDAPALWRDNAAAANRAAARLAAAMEGLPGVSIVAPPAANCLFVRLPHAAIPALQEASYFYVYDEAQGLCRWMTAWDATDDAVDAFVAQVRELLGS